MRLSLDDLNRYGDNLNAIASEASKTFSNEMRNYLDEMVERYGDISTWDKTLRDQLRDYATDLIVENWEIYGDASSSLGSLFFEETLGDEMPDKAMMLDHVSRERAEASARYWMRNLFGEQADANKFVDGCASFVERNVSHSADMAVLDGSLALGEEGKRIKYGRVPVGPTCGFCIMLASRGFVYANKRSAGDEGGQFNRFHNKCNCRVVAGYEGLEVEGYDYRGMYDRYKACRDAVGGYDQLWDDWRALSQEEKDEYGKGERVGSDDPEIDAWTRAKIGNQANAVNDYMMKRIVQEMDTRDREWMYSGKPPEVDTSAVDVSRLNESQKHTYDKELTCAKALANKGFNVCLIDDPNSKPIKGMPKFDYCIGGSQSLWEAKCPEGSGYLAVAGNIAKADEKFKKIGSKSRIVLSNLESTMSDEQFWAYFEESLSDPKSDYSNVQEILFVFKDGSVRRWVK